KSKSIVDDKKIPMMGVMAAFIFAAQMINFTIPITGSSGHIGGGILLAAMLGGDPGVLAISAVLLIQAFFFADGGLLALGCNIFNMGFWPCLIIYPLIFKPLLKKNVTSFKLMWVSILCVIISLQLGAFSVVLETLASGITALPFTQFVLLMQPIHLAIGIVEGIITGGVLIFVHNARPEIIDANLDGKSFQGIEVKKVAAGLLIAALIVGGGISLFASANPDGLEWAMFGNAQNGYRAGMTTEEALAEGANGGIYESAANLQKNTAFMPDYGFKNSDSAAGTTTAGIVGSIVTLCLAGGAGFAIYAVNKNKKKNKANAEA
ncbi:MAG: energy-coupling factor ABC transporter permease, partial [Clostridiales bacterium]